jgi:chromosome segregation ATPase
VPISKRDVANRIQAAMRRWRDIDMQHKYRRTGVLSAFWVAVVSVTFLGACSQAYYGAMEKVGIHKRDILVDRVEDARDAQSEAQKQFTSALEQFSAVVHIENSDLKSAYEKLNTEYQDSKDAAQNVSKRIDKVESVADALFEEWAEELKLYKSAELLKSSRQKLRDTKIRYREMLASMRRAEKSMEPVLRSFRDNVLFLKHNLNAQAIGSLRSEFSALKGEIDGLIKSMNEAINTSNKFIADIKQ